MERVELVNVVISRMLVHFFHLYSWLVPCYMNWRNMSRTFYVVGISILKSFQLWLRRMLVRHLMDWMWLRQFMEWMWLSGSLAWSPKFLYSFFLSIFLFHS